MNTAYPSTVFLFMLCLASASIEAGIYKWVDENGQVHYGERPAGTDAERMRLKTTGPVKTRIPEDTEAGGQDKTAGEQPAAPQQTKDELVQVPLTSSQKRRLCANARDHLSNIQSSPRLRANDGSNRIMSEQERQQRIREVRKDIREYCR